MTPTFETLCGLVSKMEVRKGNLADRLDNILDRARGNANDTIYVEKERPEADFDKVAIASIRNILSYESDAPVARWFAKHGIDF